LSSSRTSSQTDNRRKFKIRGRTFAVCASSFDVGTPPTIDHSSPVPATRHAPQKITPIDAIARSLRRGLVLLRYCVFLRPIHIKLHLVFDCVHRIKLTKLAVISWPLKKSTE
jgi:hypothetical protein